MARRARQPVYSVFFEALDHGRVGYVNISVPSGIQTWQWKIPCEWRFSLGKITDKWSICSMPCLNTGGYVSYILRSSSPSVSFDVFWVQSRACGYQSLAMQVKIQGLQYLSSTSEGRSLVSVSWVIPWKHPQENHVRNWLSMCCGKPLGATFKF